VFPAYEGLVWFRIGARTAALSSPQQPSLTHGQDRASGLPETARIALERTERLAATLIGQPEDEARVAAQEAGITVRIAGRDGQTFPLSADMQFSPVNLVIDRGVVTQAIAS
jgi:hypothetical protein